MICFLVQRLSVLYLCSHNPFETVQQIRACGRETPERWAEWIPLILGLETGEPSLIPSRAGGPGHKARRGNKKPLREEGSHAYLARLEPYRPRLPGLALAPWWRHQVAGRFIGPGPSAPLLIVTNIMTQNGLLVNTSLRGLDSLTWEVLRCAPDVLAGQAVGSGFSGCSP